LELFGLCYSVDFEAKLSVGIDERMDISEGVEHPYFAFEGGVRGRRNWRGIEVSVEVMVVEGLG
jgi:hypothetical protein